MSSELSGFFCPKSVAVLGASRTADKVGSIILRNIKNSGFKGNIYPINPNTSSIDDLACYKDVYSLPEVPDLIVVALPAEVSVSVLEDIGKAKIKNVVILAAGFKEIGNEGKLLEEKLIETSKKYQLNVLGPNCLGFVNNNYKLNATFGQPVNTLGNIKFISQSGAVAASIFDWAASLGFGLSEFITLGNKAVLNENDILSYFLYLSSQEPKANWPIGMYLESISDGDEFLKLTTELSKKHPIFIIKPGKTEAAATAMKSHTGAMAGADDVLDAALQQAGVIRCASLEDFFDMTRGFSWGLIPNGPRVAVVSNAGGPGVLTADAVILEGLELAQFDEKTKSELLEFLPTICKYS
jgi:acetate---CoA ligase (ADP-forming)